MKKWNIKTWLLIILTFCFLELGAQSRLLIQGTPSNWYVVHIVSPKESLYQLSQKFALQGKELAYFNEIKEDTRLREGSEIKIPINKQNFVQKSSVEEGWFTPLYHEVKKGETLFSIGQRYFGVKVDQLLLWNKKGEPKIKVGDQLIIGYLKSGNASLNSDQLMGNNSESIHPSSQSEINKVDLSNATKATVSSSLRIENAKKADIPDEGFFASLYPAAQESTTQQFKTGDAHIFKSITGWQNKKYYVLMNDVREGTLVRITTIHNKSICAKVLGPLPEGKSSQGLILRMSNAAAAALGMGEEKFAVNVTYFQ